MNYLHSCKMMKHCSRHCWESVCPSDYTFLLIVASIILGVVILVLMCILMKKCSYSHEYNMFMASRSLYPIDVKCNIITENKDDSAAKGDTKTDEIKVKVVIDYKSLKSFFKSFFGCYKK